MEELSAQLVDYTFNIAKVLQSAVLSDIIYFNNKEAKQVLSEFLSDPSPSACFVLKTQDDSGEFRFVVMRELVPVSGEVSTVVLVKDKGPIDALPFETKIQVMNLPKMARAHRDREPSEADEAATGPGGDGEAVYDSRRSYESLRSLVSLGILPYFESIAQQGSTATNSSEMEREDAIKSEEKGASAAVVATKKKFTELAFSLQQILQSVNVPNLLLSVHPTINKLLDEADKAHKDPMDLVTDDLLNDSVFLNQLQNVVAGWVKATQETTKLSKDAVDGSVQDEISFWSSLESALASLQEQLNSKEVEFTLNVLRKAKRFYATVSLSSDIGLKEALTVSTNYNQLLKDLPINELLTATTFKKVEESIVIVMNHMKKLRVTSYPISRSLQLVEAISSDLEAKLRAILVQNNNLMDFEYDEFLVNFDEVSSVFSTFDRQLKEFINLARELLRKRSEKFIFVKINSKTTALKERLDFLLDFRRQHNELVLALVDIMDNNNDYEEALNELDLAFESFKRVAVTDTSSDGSKKLRTAERIYHTRVQKVESRMNLMLIEVVQQSRTMQEMYTIYNRYKFLLTKPNSSSISEFQSKLLKLSNENVANFQAQFVKQTESNQILRLRDIQKVSSVLIWAKQIDTKVTEMLEKLDLMLGKNWNDYSEGQKVFIEASVFKNKVHKIDKSLFEKWLNDITSNKGILNSMEYFVLKVAKENDSFKLLTNFDEDWVSLFKEIRNLCYLEYPIPHQLISISRTLRKAYPFVVHINEAIYSLDYSIKLFDDLDGLEVLILEDKRAVLENLSSVFGVKWDDLAKAVDHGKLSNKLRSISGGSNDENLTILNAFEQSVSNFRTKVLSLQKFKEEISSLMADLTTCEFSKEIFQGKLRQFQEVLTSIVLKNFDNVGFLVSKLNSKIKKILVQRLKQKLLMIKDEDSLETLLPETRHEIVLINQTISIVEPLEYTKIIWVRFIKDIVDSVQDLSLINDNFDLSDSTTENKALLSVHLEVEKEYLHALRQVQKLHQSCKSYADSWLKFQTLWDLHADDIYEYLKSDIRLWIDVMNDLRKSRTLFDTFETKKKIGPLTFDYELIQFRVNSKYDNWQKQILLKFTEILSNDMRKLENDIVSSKTYLEANSLNLTSTKDTVQLISNVHKYKGQMKEWSELISLFWKCHQLLVKNRFLFPSDWLHVEQMEDDFGALQQILSKRTAQIENDTTVIVKKVENEASRLKRVISDFKANWNDKKPVSGFIEPFVALKSLSSFESSFSDIEAQKTLLQKASQVLLLPLTFDEDVDGLNSVFEEINDFKLVWNSIELLINNLNKIGSTVWDEVVPRVVRKKLDELLTSARAMPAKIRQYSSFEQLQKNIKQHILENKLISELKSDAMKRRHWEELFRLVDKTCPKTLTLSNVWHLDLQLNESKIKEILSKANGEKLIEDSLVKIQETWGGNVTLQFFQYQGGKCRLIKGWDSYFKQCSEDLELLGAMHHSNHYQRFEDSIATWESRLNKLYVILDVWIEVQRQWVYLDGVFGDNKDIQRLLPVESSRFQNTTNDFFRFLKNVYKSSFVIDVIKIDDIQVFLERELEILNRIKKALGDYLEKQRDFFPRFYFIGNDDLLNIIGNSDNPTYISNFMNKVYSNVYGIDFKDGKIHSIFSKEHEIVQLKNPIEIAKHGSLIEWLKELEFELKQTLSEYVKEATKIIDGLIQNKALSLDTFLDWIKSFPCQCVLMAIQICWTKAVDQCVSKESTFEDLKDMYKVLLTIATSAIVTDLEFVEREKLEILIVELVYQQNVISSLSENAEEFEWKKRVKFYLNSNCEDFHESVTVKHVDSEYFYGFEYQGLNQGLVRNSIMENIFINYNEALSAQKGGCSFGPAGTGKTESVKDYGRILGIPVFVFCCDESFDFASISRILLGICRIGAWVCFDEFNRLESNMLSAISSQIERIETSLSLKQNFVDLLGTKAPLDRRTSIFITMNPTYEGRSALPENLKKLFRNYSITRTDRVSIVEVILYSQGFNKAGELAQLVVSSFESFQEKFSSQRHYDFGLRAVKAAIVYCGKLKRQNISENEFSVIYDGIKSSIMPKLVEEDVIIFKDIMAEKFSEEHISTHDDGKLKEHIHTVMKDMGLPSSSAYVDKILQLSQISLNHHGLIIVGESGTGKTTIRNILLKSLQAYDGVESLVYVINPKIDKSQLYGSLDTTTREFKDGLFTAILRKIVSNLRGELEKRIWIVFDGDVDPEWIENLNSLLDDNKIFTLPNGEHISLPQNVKILFETDSLKHATPATVSRCGMIWVPRGLISSEALLEHNYVLFDKNSTSSNELIVSVFLEVLKSEFAPKLSQIVLESTNLKHVFQFIVNEKISTFIKFYYHYFKKFMSYYEENDSLFTSESFGAYARKAMVLSVFWAFAGDCDSSEQLKFNNFATSLFNVDVSLMNETVVLPEISWTKWADLVQPSDIGHEYTSVNEQMIIPTLDTVRLESIIDTLVSQERFLILCGPPGSGKTMTVLDVLRKSNRDVISINFSGKTTIQDLLSTLYQYCHIVKTSAGMVLKPKNNKETVCFIDEINLPALDKFGSQPVISFLRSLMDLGGYYSQNTFVSLEKIKFVGACNPSWDEGRNELSSKFLKHCSLIFVDYPSKESLRVIYSTFAETFLVEQPKISGFSSVIVESIIEIYLQLKQKLSVLSPRDLTRFMRSIFQGLHNNNVNLEEFLRLYVHECLRLFSDRVENEELRSWIYDTIKKLILELFPGCDTGFVFSNPIIFSKWLSTTYESVDIEQYRSFVYERLRVFSNEVLDTNLILYQDCLDHIARLDRVLSIPQGHLILVGNSTSGKTTLCRFVAWVNGLEVVQLSVNKSFGLHDFDAVLKELLKRAGVYGERICFIIDESNILESSFIERMNTLLANSEVPSLFNANELSELMGHCLEQSQQQGLLLDTEEELYQWFTQQVSNNLHVIFTLNNTSEEHSSGVQILNSPALLNRCVVNWMGDWSNDTLRDVALGSIRTVNNSSAIIDSLIEIHRSQNNALPGQFMLLLKYYMQLYQEKEQKLEENQRHINVGLDKLRDTVLSVKELKTSLSAKQKELKEKDLSAKKMLDTMLTEQNEAERKQEFSLEFQELLKKQELEIEKHKEIVSRKLDEMVPIMESAAQNVKGISKQNLSELRTMSNPPEAIKLTLEAVSYLLGFGANLSWRDIQSVTRRSDFINSVLNFENNITKEIRNYVDRHFFSKPNFNHATVNRASKACGPLLAWIEAQIEYSIVLEQVEPLETEVVELEDSAKANKTKLLSINQVLAELQESIARYKEDYSVVIREIENIKSEMLTVDKKVKRSLALMESLTIERNRWSKASFTSEKSQLAGDCVIGASFLTYAGYYDHKFRAQLLKTCQSSLAEREVPFDEHFSTTEFFTTPQEVLNWQEHKLPSDLLYAENMILCHKYYSETNIPFLIDPSGQIVEILQENLLPKKLVITSFLDEGFLKQVENSLRFGTAILIEDAEHIDPVITSVLKKEIFSAGGRSLIRLGGQEIDCSPNFQMFLFTRNSKIRIPSHIYGRTNVINFTTTRGSLEDKVVNTALVVKDPEVNEQRQNLIKLNGEYKAHLRKLEDDLLLKLSISIGNILDDNDLISTLEQIKSESNEIQHKMQESTVVMDKVNKILEKYSKLAVHSACIFAILRSFQFIDKFYMFSLEFLLKIFNYVIELKGDSVDFYVRELYKEVYKRAILSLRQEDQPKLALSLYWNFVANEQGKEVETIVISIINSIKDGKPLPSVNLEEQTPEIRDILAPLVDSGILTDKMQQILEVFNVETTNSMDSIASVFGSYTSQETPIILASVDGYDPTFKVRAIANEMNTKVHVVAMGSQEVIEIVNKELKAANSEGSWLLVQNAHMAQTWLDYLGKTMASLALNPSFRLILTCTTTSDLPTTLLSSGYVVMFENQPGLKNCMRDVLGSIPVSEFEKNPVERKHVMFLLVWFHSVIQERSRFIPVGWKCNYDFNNTDFEFSLHIINRVFERISKNRVNVAPESIPWKELQYMIGNLGYGGKVDDESDFNTIVAFAKSIFNVSTFEHDFNLASSKNTSTIAMPEAKDLASYKSWIENLPNVQDPTWIDLPSDVESIVSLERSKTIAQSVIEITEEVEKF